MPAPRAARAAHHERPPEVRGVRARFDDLVGGTSLVFDGARAVLVAERAEEVAALLEEVDRATRRGAWAAGFLAYEAAPGLDATLAAAPRRAGTPEGDLPLGWFALFDAPGAAPPLVPGAAAARAGGTTPPAGAPAGPGGQAPGAYELEPFVPDTGYAEYVAQVAAVREAIAAGDTYQCNLTVRLRSRATGDLGALYRDLALAQGGAHCAFLETGRHALLSASPELFFEWRGDRITARPMKGTATRGPTPAADEAQAQGLAASAKERAENVMIVDLLRNDLGRIAEWGSVEVPALFQLEPYPTVWQMTSTVTARPRPGTGLVDVFRALFPCGSVTGAPKRRTMELIAALERTPRGAYCGAAGVVAPPGAPFRARFGVPIRTLVVDQGGGEAVYGTGSGVTWGSRPAAEHAELLAKALILDAAAGEVRLLETMAFVPGEGLRNVARHLARLAASADALGFAHDPDAVAAALHDGVDGVSEASRVRLTVDRAGRAAVELGPLPPRGAAPVRLAVDRRPVRSADRWLRHKTTRRAPYVERAARHPGADDVVLVNEHGRPTETTIANLLVRLDGRWWTPPLEAGCLPGVERGRLIEGGAVAERGLELVDLRRAEALAVVSSLRGWRPAVLAVEPAPATGASRPGRAATDGEGSPAPAPHPAPGPQAPAASSA